MMIRILVLLVLLSSCLSQKSPSWSVEAPLPGTVSDVACGVLDNELIAVASAGVSNDKSKSATKTYIYNFESGKWRAEDKDWLTSERMAATDSDGGLHFHGYMLKDSGDPKKRGNYFDSIVQVYVGGRKGWSDPLQAYEFSGDNVLGSSGLSLGRHKNRTIACGGRGNDSGLTKVCASYSYLSENVQGSLLSDMSEGTVGSCYGVVDGNLVVAGGQDSKGGARDDVSMLNIGDNQWNDDVAGLSLKKMDMSSVVHRDKLWCIGGQTGDKALATIDVITPSTGTVQQAKPLPSPYYGGCAVQRSGRIWLIAGSNKADTPTDRFLSIPAKIDALKNAPAKGKPQSNNSKSGPAPAKSSWRELSPLPVDMTDVSCAVVGDRLMVVTSNDVAAGTVSAHDLTFWYSFESRTWSGEKKPWGTTRGSQLGEIGDSMFSVTGDDDEENKKNGDQLTSVVWVLPKSDGKWNTKQTYKLPNKSNKDMPGPIYPSIPEMNNTLYQCGGTHGAEAKEASRGCRGFQRVSRDRYTTVDLPSMKRAAAGACYGSRGEEVFVVGGWEGNKKGVSGRVQSLGLGDKEWQQWKDDVELGVPRSQMASVVVEGDKLWCIGGLDGNDKVVKTVDIVDLKTQTITQGSPLPEGHHGGCAAVYKDVVYLVAGSQRSGDKGSKALYGLPLNAKAGDGLNVANRQLPVKPKRRSPMSRSSRITRAAVVSGLVAAVLSVFLCAGFACGVYLGTTDEFDWSWDEREQLPVAADPYQQYGYGNEQWHPYNGQFEYQYPQQYMYPNHLPSDAGSMASHQLLQHQVASSGPSVAYGSIASEYYAASTGSVYDASSVASYVGTSGPQASTRTVPEAHPNEQVIVYSVAGDAPDSYASPSTPVGSISPPPQSSPAWLMQQQGQVVQQTAVPAGMVTPMPPTTQQPVPPPPQSISAAGSVSAHSPSPREVVQGLVSVKGRSGGARPSGMAPSTARSGSSAQMGAGVSVVGDAEGKVRSGARPSSVQSFGSVQSGMRYGDAAQGM